MSMLENSQVCGLRWAAIDMVRAIITFMEISFKLKYEKPEVISAQRLRFRYSSRLQIIAILGVFSIGYLSYLQFQLPIEARNWASPGLVAAIFILVPALIFYISPILDFIFNKGWRKEYRFVLSESNMDIFQPDEHKPYRFDLNRVNRILENPDVFILIFGNEQNFVIVPKRLLQAQGKEGWFRNNMEIIRPAKWNKSGM